MMANIRCYFGIENLNLTVGQRSTLVTGLQSLGVNNASLQPHERNHWAIRPDNNAIIFDALFDDTTLTIAAIKARLATIFGVAVGTISHTTQQTVYGLVITFTHSAQDKIRMVAFGHNGTSWGTLAESNAAARTYLIANAVAWGAN
jgi:hypothetical protein